MKHKKEDKKDLKMEKPHLKDKMVHKDLKKPEKKK